MRIYLDNYCFNRPFDDQSQIRINLEAEAKLKNPGLGNFHLVGGGEGFFYKVYHTFTKSIAGFIVL